MRKTYLLLGGARSGKSSFGEKLAASIPGRVAYFATAKITDKEMEKRVRTHQERRPKNWKTFEISSPLGKIGEIEKIFKSISSEKFDTVLIDCITNLIFQVIDRYKIDDLEVLANKEEERIEKEVIMFFKAFVKILEESSLNIIVISNEIGLGVVPAFPLGRIFRDLMGAVNKEMARVSDEVYFFIAGLKQRLK